MATFAQIKEVRLRIDDPAGYINILSVADLPETPVNQTAYLYNGSYWEKDTTWQTLNLYVSDDRISTWYDLHGEDYACVQSLKQIIAKLGKEIRLKKADTGAESTEWTSLQELLNYYEYMLAQFQEDYNDSINKSGSVWGSTKTTEIAGDNI